MDIVDDLPDNLPKTNEKIESAFNDCLKEKREIVKTRTFVKVSKENYKNFIESALKALNAAKVLLDGKCFGWVVVPAYSAIYQAGNAVLIKELEKECRDHFCLLISLLKLKKIGFEEITDATRVKHELEKLSDEEISFASKLRLVRSDIIYRPSEKYNEEKIAKEIFEKSKNFVNHLAGEI